MFKEAGYDWGQHIDVQRAAHSQEDAALERFTQLSSQMQSMLSEPNVASQVRLEDSFISTLHTLDSGSENETQLLSLLYGHLERMQQDLTQKPDGVEWGYYGYSAEEWRTQRLNRMERLKAQFQKLKTFGPTIEAAH